MLWGEKAVTVKRICGLAALILWLSIPAHAQHAMGGSSNGVASASGSAGGGTGGGGSQVSFPTLPSYPQHEFLMTNVSGTKADFTPSTYLDYDQALTDGRAALASKMRPLAEIAKQNRESNPAKAKIAILQDANGRAFLASQ
jgi:hypothetical protein